MEVDLSAQIAAARPPSMLFTVAFRNGCVNAELRAASVKPGLLPRSGRSTMPH
jgi:hypothetical protein